MARQWLLKLTIPTASVFLLTLQLKVLQPPFYVRENLSGDQEKLYPDSASHSTSTADFHKNHSVNSLQHSSYVRENLSGDQEKLYPDSRGSTSHSTSTADFHKNHSVNSLQHSSYVRENVSGDATHSPAPSTADLHKINSLSSLQLPFPRATRSLDDVMRAQWVAELWQFLSGLENSHVTLCIADSRYMEGVLNWLVSALVVIHPPLENVLVISLDAELYGLLRRHHIDSVFIDPQTVLLKNVKLPTNYSHIWTTRMVLFRLLNHWSYTVATYDSDAILVKNPQLLYAELDDSDLVGSEGSYPFDLHREWRSPTFCMGVALFRPSARTEVFWNLLSEVQLSLEKFDDQVLTNNALKQCNITWHTPAADSFIHGMCPGLGLKVALLPATTVCRLCGEEEREWYVWHQRTARSQEDKKRAAEKAGMWFLKWQQNMEHNKLKGIEWLRYLCSA